MIESPPTTDPGIELGRSREGRRIRGYRLGSGREAISLLGGAHADEPVGPRLLRCLVSGLSGLERTTPRHELLQRYQWWIVPQINPDGEARNASWADPDPDPGGYDLGTYLRHRVRELPGDDIEFGFPQNDGVDPLVRPENRAVFEWWLSSERPFALHATLHGMGFAAGPWFLVEPAWRGRLDDFKRICGERTHALGYVLHDVERGGEKGFVRIERGFTTRPDSEAMRAHFLASDDPETAARFRPSSMEAIRSLGHDTLTLVSEIPLFLTPGVGETLGPPDPVALIWRDRVARWQADVNRTGDAARVSGEASRAGLRPMPLYDQMDLQWTMILAGLMTVGGFRINDADRSL